MSLLLTTRSPYAPPVEFVERKGIGHPDTICDALAEGLAQRMGAEYIENTGAVQPFNVDKALLAAGTAEVSFGGGTMHKPARLIIAGRADFSHSWEPDREALVKGAEQDLAEILPDADPDSVELDIWLGQTSAELAVVLSGRGDQVPLSNDTSFAAVSLPYSPLEDVVHKVETHLNSATFRGAVPVGRDIKIMGGRVEDRITLTVAAPVMSRQIGSRADYEAAIGEIRAAVVEVARHLVGDAEVHVNGADSEHTPYLTLFGSSAESGDDGQVGRGNRFGGLITPYRPMSLEAAAGKNPAAHVGKTYHAIAHDIARRVLSETPATETTVRMLSSIGRPVTDPQATHFEVSHEADETQVSAIVRECLDDWSGVRDRLIAGKYELY